MNLSPHKSDDKEKIKEGVWIKIKNLKSAFQNADAVVVLTEWDEYANINWNEASSKMRQPSWVFDVRSIVDPQEVMNSGINFWRIGDGLK